MSRVVSLTLLLPLLVLARNSLLLTPPMGWMSWELFRCNLATPTDDCTNPLTTHCISEALYKGQADALVSGGFAAAGYTGIHMDDCWAARTRDPVTGELQPNATRFPSGMAVLGTYLHSRNLTFGLYSAENTHTCAGYPASLYVEGLDAKTFASWGVDYAKIDGCGSDVNYPAGYKRMGAALEASGRPIAYSCSYPAYTNFNNETLQPYSTLIMDGCNLWRNYHDIQCSWGSMLNIMNHFGEWGSVLAPYAGPGHWHDPDMLLIGSGCLSLAEERTQMAIWSVLAAPLIMGNDLRNVSTASAAILTNPRAISIDQDPLGQMGLRVQGGDATPSQVWARLLADGRISVAATNNLGGVSPPAPCPAWNHTPGGYFDSCGGGMGWFYNRTLDQAQALCCENVYCAGILFPPGVVIGSGTFVLNTGCGFVPSTVFSEYTKEGFSPPMGGDIDIPIDLAAAGLDALHAWEVTDVWSGAHVGSVTKGAAYFTAASVAFHDTAFLLFTRVQ
jgi:hypothetical protein